MTRFAVAAGQLVRDERRRRRWSLRVVAGRAGISAAHLGDLEAGGPVSLETYARVFTALDMRFELGETGAARVSGRPSHDVVHAAMGELEARRFRGKGFEVAIDEPYQHYQFAGRADVIAWHRGSRALLHIENRTQFPNVQEALGSFGSKRAYLGRVLAERLGFGGSGWASETHVIVALWSSEVLHVLRRRETTFRVTCPDPVEPFETWWAGDHRALPRTSSILVLMDPDPAVAERFRFASFDRLSARPRYRDYRDAADRLETPSRR